MKKLIISVLAALSMATFAVADEGMWMLPLLQQLNSKAMADLGCKLTPDQIYSVNHSSLKDAVVIFGGGCTGEVISDEGLLVTNHHCGYSSIQALSTDEHNYLENGYWAMDRSQEIPVPGLTVTFLVSMEDITNQMTSAEEQLRKTFADSANVDQLVARSMDSWRRTLEDKSNEENPNCRSRITSFYSDNVYYMIVYKIYNDVRFVGAPPASIGKFGGETDNWMWPRHTGDFSMFRIYAGPDNEPAEYSAENKPYVPKQSLKISLKGYNEGDFAMIMGYPGRTQRFQTADQLQLMMDTHDVSIAARTVRQDIMWEWMEKSPSIRLKYANKYAGSANGWKKWIGEKKAFNDLNIIEREKQKEADFMKWAGKNKKRQAKYGTAIKDISEYVAVQRDPQLAITLLSETVGRIELMGLVENFFQDFDNALETVKDTSAALKQAYEEMKPSYDDYWEPLDREETAALLDQYRKNAKPEDYLEGLGEDFATMDLKKYADKLFDNSAFTSPEKLQSAIDDGFSSLEDDPALKLEDAFMNVLMNYFAARYSDNGSKGAEATKTYTAGLLEWQKGKAIYPDANFTTRLTYGTVKSYSPKDAVHYNYYTTIYGVIQKEDPDNYEFRVPEKLKELYMNKDYGRYAMADGNLPCCFLTNCDITGGNSGSPVMNANGELIGLAFDGNWESMSSDVMFEPDLQRCICVDIRYVLFLMDKFGGAGYLLNEMNIVD
jgi:hypothetical protein